MVMVNQAISRLTSFSVLDTDEVFDTPSLGLAVVLVFLSPFSILWRAAVPAVLEAVLGGLRGSC